MNNWMRVLMVGASTAAWSVSSWPGLGWFWAGAFIALIVSVA